MLKSKEENGKALNALDLPMLWTDEGISHKLATDRVAFQATTGTIGFPRTTDYFPLNQMQWGLCNTAGTMHAAHVDSDGTATEVRPKNEEAGKWWIFGIPKNGKSMADIHFFDSDSYDPYHANTDLFTYEAVYLQCGISA